MHTIFISSFMTTQKVVLLIYIVPVIISICPVYASISSSFSCPSNLYVSWKNATHNGLIVLYQRSISSSFSCPSNLYVSRKNATHNGLIVLYQWSISISFSRPTNLYVSWNNATHNRLIVLYQNMMKRDSFQEVFLLELNVLINYTWGYHRHVGVDSFPALFQC